MKVNGLRRDDERPFYLDRKRKAVQIDPTWENYYPCDSSFEVQAPEELDNTESPQQGQSPSEKQSILDSNESPPSQPPPIVEEKKEKAKSVRRRRPKRQRLRKPQDAEKIIVPGVSV